MLIVEGPDGAGKTTLIEAIQEYFGDIEVAPRVVSKEAKAMVDLRQWVDQNLLDGFQYKVFDRHRLISQPIYGPIMRRTSDGFDKLSWVGPRVYELYNTVKPVIIYCLPDKDTVKANIFNDPNNQAIEPYIDSLYDAYVAKAAQDHAFNPGRIRVWDYNNSLTVNGLPAFFPQLHEQMKWMADV